MHAKKIRTVFFLASALTSMILFQNLTPTEMNDTISSALQEKDRTEELLNLQPQDHLRREPASISIPMQVQYNLDDGLLINGELPVMDLEPAPQETN